MEINSLRKREGKRRWEWVVLLAVVMWPLALGADEKKEGEIKVDKSLDKLKIGLLGYIDYSWGTSPRPDGEKVYYNTFSATRGYLTVQKTFLPWLGGRITLDITQDKEDKLKIKDTEWDPGSGRNVDRTEEYPVPSDLEGTYMVRFKYLYMELRPKDLVFLTDMKAEVGMGHIPWLHFEDRINPYRCQGTMAIERAGVFNSADLGVSLRGYLGGTLEEAEAKTGNKDYAGRYGSWHLGVYNGPGYTAVEKNQNKVFEGRISLRPLPDVVPGLQLSYFYLTGDGNKSYEWKKDTYWPYYRAQIGMLSFEHPNVTFTAQYFTTDGNAKGTWVYGKKGAALPTVGWSYFLNVGGPLGPGKFSVFGRYDYFDIDPEDKLDAGETAYRLTICGLAYDFHKGNMILLVYESTDYEEDANLKGRLPVKDNELGREDKFQLVYQLKL